MITKCSCRISCGRSILFGGLHALSSFSQICYSSQLLSFFRLHSVTFISLFSNCRQSLCPLKEKMFFKAALKIFLIFFENVNIKCDTFLTFFSTDFPDLLFKQFARRMIAMDLPRIIIHPAFNRRYFFIRFFIEVCSFRNMSSDHFICHFVASSFIAAVRMTIICLCPAACSQC